MIHKSWVPGWETNSGGALIVEAQAIQAQKPEPVRNKSLNARNAGIDISNKSKDLEAEIR